MRLSHAASLLLLHPLLVACADGPPQPPDDAPPQTPDVEPCQPAQVNPDPPTVAWVSAEPDLLMPLFVHLPEDEPRLGHALEVTAEGPSSPPHREGFSVVAVALFDASGRLVERVATCEVPEPSLGTCRTVTPPLLNAPRPGDSMEVTVEWTHEAGPSGCFVPPEEPTTFTVAVPEPPAGDSTHALAAARTSDGTLWLGLLPVGLVGLTPDGRSVIYPGIPTNVPWLEDHTAPQTPLLFDIQHAGDGALWLGGANTGISWFDPGADLHDPSDDRWAHALPPLVLTAEGARDGFLTEMAETTMALVPTEDDSLWVASLHGLHRVKADASPLALETVARGAFLTLAQDDGGVLWAGRTIAPGVMARWGVDPWPDAPLLSIQSDEVGGLDITPFALPIEAVTALAHHAGLVFVGTPAGLYAFDPGADAPTLEPVAAELLGELAVVSMVTVDESLWVAARHECETDRGRLLRLNALTGALEDASERGFRLRDFNALRDVGGGQLFVSTVVPKLSEGLFQGTLTERRCEATAQTTHAGADSYLMPLDGGDALPIGP